MGPSGAHARRFVAQLMEGTSPMTDLPNSIASYVLVGMNETDFLENLADQGNLPASDRRPLSTYDRNGRYRILAYLNEVSASLGISAFWDAGKTAIHLYPG